MSQPFEVDAATLHAAAGDVRSTRTDVETDLANLWNVVDDLAMAWKGQASAGFQQLMGQWNGDVKSLLQSMDDIADLLDKSGTTHQVNDEQQAQMLNKYTSLNQPQ